MYNMNTRLIFTLVTILFALATNAQAPFNINGYWQHSDANKSNILPTGNSISYIKIKGANDDIRSCQPLAFAMPVSFKFSFNFSVSTVSQEGAALIPVAFTTGNIPVSNPDKDPSKQTYQDALGIIFQTPHKNNKDLQLAVYLKHRDKPFTNLYAEFIKINYNQTYKVVLQRCSATEGAFSVFENGQMIGKKTFSIPSGLAQLNYMQASNMVQASAMRSCNAFANLFEYTTELDNTCAGNAINNMPELPPNIPTETSVNEETKSIETTITPASNSTIKVGNKVFTNPNPNSTGGCCIMLTGSINNYIGGTPDLESNYNTACFQHNTLNYAFANAVRLETGFAKWQGPDKPFITEYTNNVATKQIVFENDNISHIHYKKESYMDLGDGKNNKAARTLYTIDYFFSKNNYKPDSAIGYAGADKAIGYQTIIYTYKKNNVIAATLKNSKDGSVQNYKVELDKGKYNRLHLSFRINYFVGLQTFTNPNLLFTINGLSGDQVNDIIPVENNGTAKAYHFDYTYIKENVKTYISSIRGSNGMKLDFTYDCQKLKVNYPIFKEPTKEIPTELPPPNKGNVESTDGSIKILPPNKENPIKILPPPVKDVPIVKDTTPKVYANLLTTEKEKMIAGKWKKVDQYQLDYHFDDDKIVDSVSIVPLANCTVDDFTEFRTDFTYGEVLGETPCPNPQVEIQRAGSNGKWSVQDIGGKLVLELGRQIAYFKIIKLTQNELIYQSRSLDIFDNKRNRKIYNYYIQKYTR
jgi:hypothetical protein